MIIDIKSIKFPSIIFIIQNGCSFSGLCMTQYSILSFAIFYPSPAEVNHVEIYGLDEARVLLSPVPTDAKPLLNIMEVRN